MCALLPLPSNFLPYSRTSPHLPPPLWPTSSSWFLPRFSPFAGGSLHSILTRRGLRRLALVKDDLQDSLRYTVSLPHASYTKSVQQTFALLDSKGYSVVKSKNYWGEGDDYQGLNCIYKASDGFPFELQFHTPESLVWPNTPGWGSFRDPLLEPYAPPVGNHAHPQAPFHRTHPFHAPESFPLP